MTLEVINKTTDFEVLVMGDDGRTILHRTGWRGCEYFTINGEKYSLLGPCHGTEDNRFHLFRLVEVALA